LKISAQEEYGFRCILQIAAYKGEKPLAAAEIAEAEGLSVPYVNKLLNILKRAGLVVSVRGVNGGYQLSRSLDKITPADVLNALNGLLFSPNFCKYFTGRKVQCVHYSKSCTIRSVWSVLSEHIEGVLSEMTLEDLVEKKEPFVVNLMRLKFGEQALRSGNRILKERMVGG